MIFISPSMHVLHPVQGQVEGPGDCEISVFLFCLKVELAVIK